MIKGEQVILYVKKPISDHFGSVEIEEQPVVIDNVLIAPGVSQDLLNSTDLNGVEVSYTLAIPKGDTHEWTGCRVSFRGDDYQVVGMPYYCDPKLVPLYWNGKVMVKRYE